MFIYLPATITWGWTGGTTGLGGLTSGLGSTGPCGPGWFGGPNCGGLLKRLPVRQVGPDGGDPTAIGDIAGSPDTSGLPGTGVGRTCIDWSSMSSVMD